MNDYFTDRPAPGRREMEDALARRTGPDLQKAFAGATVAILGLGGLGSNIAVMLARAGVGRLILADFDRVDVTNLNRQQYKACQTGMLKTEALRENLLEIAPYADLITVTEKITEASFDRSPESDCRAGMSSVFALLGKAGIICEAFDDPAAKAMVVNNVLEKFPQKYIIASSGMAGLGSSNAIKTRRVSERFFICGDGVSDAAERPGLISARVALCAAHQANMALRILAGQTEA